MTSPGDALTKRGLNEMRARVEAERRDFEWETFVAEDGIVSIRPSGMTHADAFVAGAAWQAAQPVVVSAVQVEAATLHLWDEGIIRPESLGRLAVLGTLAALGITTEPTPAHDLRCERLAFHDPSDSPCTWRERSCVEKWSGCESGEYNPACCRFPKSCSVRDVPVEPTL